jgi:hypothetical protein
VVVSVAGIDGDWVNWSMLEGYAVELPKRKQSDEATARQLSNDLLVSIFKALNLSTRVVSVLMLMMCDRQGQE